MSILGYIAAAMGIGGTSLKFTEITMEALGWFLRGSRKRKAEKEAFNKWLAEKNPANAPQESSNESAA